MSKVKKLKFIPEATRVFLRKPANEKWRLLRIVTLSFAVRIMILLFPFKKLAAILGEQNIRPDQKSAELDWFYIDMVSRQIKNVSRYVPWTSNCLVQATVCKILLRDKSIGSTVSFGVKKSGNDMKAHAWLAVGPKIVLGGENVDQFVEVSSFS